MYPEEEYRKEQALIEAEKEFLHHMDWEEQLQREQRPAKIVLIGRNTLLELDEYDRIEAFSSEI